MRVQMVHQVNREQVGLQVKVELVVSLVLLEHQALLEQVVHQVNQALQVQVVLMVILLIRGLVIMRQLFIM